MESNLKPLMGLLKQANDPKLNIVLYSFAQGYLSAKQKKEKAPTGTAIPEVGAL